MPRLYDISRTVKPGLAVWPGDAPFSAQQVLDRRAGDSVNLFTLTLSAHTGTHADAPFHYDQAGAHPAALPLDPYVGPAQVIKLTRLHGGIVPGDFAGHDLADVKRLLIHTWVSEQPDDTWPDDFPYPTLELVDWLAAGGLILLGVDMPSVDPFESHDLECHHRLYAHKIANLESLCLSGVPDGRYELIALPLKLDGVCGSPVRAILRTPQQASDLQ